MPTETSLGPQNISNVLFVAKLLSETQIKASKRPSKVKPTWNPMSMRLTKLKICQILQYCLLASLVLLAGDVSPNPGWALPALNQHGLKITHLNVRSLSQHWDEFQILIQDNPFDVMCLTETWLKPSMTDSELHLDGYNLIRNDRTEKGGGGTAIYYNSMLMARQRTDINCGLDVEAILLEITFPNGGRVLVCSAYCADKTLYKDFKPCLETMLDRASSENIELLFLGDFNQDLLPKRLTADVRDLRQTFSTYQLTQLIKSPTRITDRSKTLIDHIYTSD